MNKSFSDPYLFSFFLMCSNIFSLGVMILLDKRANKFDIDHKVNNSFGGDDMEKVHFKDIKKFDFLFWLICFGTFISWGSLQYNNNL